MNLCTSVFVYVGSIGLYKRIVNADTQSIRIANADGQGSLKLLLACSVKPPPPFGYSLLSKRESFSPCLSICYYNSSSRRGGGFKNLFLKTEEFFFLISWFCCHSGGFRTPSELFSRKKFSSLFKMDSYNKCIVSNLIPHLIQAGELILFCFKMLFI